MKEWHLFSRKTKKTEEKWSVRTMFGAGLNFAATEAYKALRTNLKFSFPDDGLGKVIGVTSAIQGEGKSTTACNLAYALSVEREKVILLEADLRRPTVATKLSLARQPGLTNLLVDRESGDEAIQRSPHAPEMDVICSGDIPPNPSELLGSERMGEILAELKKKYRYIVVDLPPVNLVSDGLAMSKYMDGIVVVTREDISDRKQLDEAIRHINMVGVRILGFVFRASAGNSKKYAYKRYKKYGYYSENGK